MQKTDTLPDFIEELTAMVRVYRELKALKQDDAAVADAANED